MHAYPPQPFLHRAVGVCCNDQYSVVLNVILSFRVDFTFYFSEYLFGPRTVLLYYCNDIQPVKTLTVLTFFLPALIFLDCTLEAKFFKVYRKKLFL